MDVAPIGAFGAIAFTVGRFGPASLLALGKLVAEFYVCCALFVVLVLWPIAWGFGVNLLRADPLHRRRADDRRGHELERVGVSRG